MNFYASWRRFSQAQRPDEWRLEENQRLPDPVQTSTQTIAGISRDISPAVALRVEWYRYHWSHVHPYFDNLLNTQSLLPDLTPDRIRIAPSAADANGVEFSVRAKLGKSYRYWASYVWSRVTDRIGDVDVPRSWDQRSAITAGLGWQRGPFSLTSALLYHSGWPRTPFTATEPSAAAETWLSFGARNSGNWPDYVTADLRMSWTKPLRASQVELFFEATNLANRANPSSAALTISEPTMIATPTLGYWMPRQFYAGVTWTMH